MINWEELGKYIAPGKVCTLVIMIDGKEIGALSFDVATLAYKEILGVEKVADKINIPDKSAEKKSEPIKRETKEASVKPEITAQDVNEGKSTVAEMVNEETGEIKAVEPASTVVEPASPAIKAETPIANDSTIDDDDDWT